MVQLVEQQASEGLGLQDRLRQQDHRPYQARHQRGEYRRRGPQRHWLVQSQLLSAAPEGLQHGLLRHRAGGAHQTPQSPPSPQFPGQHPQSSQAPHPRRQGQHPVGQHQRGRRCRSGGDCRGHQGHRPGCAALQGELYRCRQHRGLRPQGIQQRLCPGEQLTQRRQGKYQAQLYHPVLPPGAEASPGRFAHQQAGCRCYAAGYSQAREQVNQHVPPPVQTSGAGCPVPPSSGALLRKRRPGSPRGRRGSARPPDAGPPAFDSPAP